MIRKSYAKINIFLKITKKRGDFHEIVSRFVKVYSLYDTIEFCPQKCDKFTLEGDFGCKIEQNTIYKAYIILCKKYPKVKEYFENHKVKVDKNIKEFAGLGGGSSNCASFLNMVNDTCNLALSLDELSDIGFAIGSDVPFFVYDFNSANVSGVGEIVKYFDEEKLDIDVITPDIKCDTKDVFVNFRDKYFAPSNDINYEELFEMQSVELVEKYDISYLNDLYKSAVDIDVKLEDFYKNIGDKYFFSGSGSSFFKVIKNG